MRERKTMKNFKNVLIAVLPFLIGIAFGYFIAFLIGVGNNLVIDFISSSILIITFAYYQSLGCITIERKP